MQYTIKTPRLGIRNWQEKDIPEMTAISNDPDVMQYFPATKTADETRKFIQRMQEQFEKTGYCYFAVDRLDTNEMIGFIGLMYQDYEVDFTPCVDIGWRLKKSAWGNGFATEGAKACLEYAFHELDLDAVLSVATRINTPSENVMQKIGMKKVKEFEHPFMLDNARLKDCILYEVKAVDWLLKK